MNQMDRNWGVLHGSVSIALYISSRKISVHFTNDVRCRVTRQQQILAQGLLESPTDA